MSKVIPTKPLLILVYGFPGAGKTYFARQLCDQLQAAHVQGDRIRSELFEQPRYDKEENAVVNQLMDYMAEEFLSAGLSVVYDANAMRYAQRHALRDMARRHKAQPLLVWLQIDPETAFLRASKRDRRKIDDKYAAPMDQSSFEALANGMQNPRNVEDYMVISGKHVFPTQFSALVKRMHELNMIPADQMANKVVKPGLVNLVPKSASSSHNPIGGRVDMSRRNIVIR
jgi:predicted kinase